MKKDTTPVSSKHYHELLLDKTSFEKGMIEVSMWILETINEEYHKTEEKEMIDEKEYIESTVNENLPEDILFRTDDGRDATLISVRIHDYNHHIFTLKGVVDGEIVSRLVFVRLAIQDCSCSFQEAQEECPEIVMAPKHITDYINDIFVGTKHNNPAPITNEEPGSYNVSSTEVSFPSAADVEYQVVSKVKERVVKAIWTAVEKEKPSCQVFIDKVFSTFIKNELIELGYTVLDEQGDNGDDIILTIIWSNYK